VTGHLAIPQDPIPVVLLTGFLGSGKTTVLKALLERPAWSRTAVIVNELGEIGLDHLLLERSGEDTLLLDGGCLCCALRSDLVVTLQSMLDRAERGELPAFDRVVVETTGLAEPGALIRTFWSDPLRLSRYRFTRTVTCVDAVMAKRTLAAYEEARRQVALADLLLITKSDLDAADGALDAARAINRCAAAHDVMKGSSPGDAIDMLATSSRDESVPLSLDAGHGTDFATVSAATDAMLSWPILERGLHEVTMRHGDRLLRLKGIVTVTEADDPIRIDAVQGLFHRPISLSQNGHAIAGSQLVAIAQSVPREVLRRDLVSLLGRSAAHELERRPG